MQTKTDTQTAEYLLGLYKVYQDALRVVNEETTDAREKLQRLITALESMENVPFPSDILMFNPLKMIMLPWKFVDIQKLPLENIQLGSQAASAPCQTVLQQLSSQIQEFSCFSSEAAEVFLKAKMIAGADIVTKLQDKPKLLQSIFEKCMEDKALCACFTLESLRTLRSTYATDSEKNPLITTLDNLVKQKQKQKQENFYSFFQGQQDPQSILTTLPTEMLGAIYEKYEML
jgi:hypothetical protein